MRIRAGLRRAYPVVVLLAMLLISLLWVASCNPQPLPVAPTRIPALPHATLPVEVAVEAALHGEEATPEPEGEATNGSTAEPSVDMGLGKQVFDTKCAICHSLSSDQLVGPGLQGMFTKTTLPDGSVVDDDGLRTWLTNGGGSMPGVPLGDEEMDSLIGFLKDSTE